MKLTYSYFLIIFISIGFIPSHAQDVIKERDSKIDSLYNLIESHDQKDKELVYLFNEYARRCFDNNEFQNGLIATRDAKIRSDELGFEDGKIMYYLTLSVYHGSGKISNYYQKQAKWLSKRLDKQMSEVTSSSNVAGQSVANSFEKLIIEYSKTLQYFEEESDKEIRANVLLKISNYYYQLGNFEEAINIDDQAIILFEELGELYPVFLVSSNKMNNLKLLGRDDDAKKIELELIELIAKNENENAVGLITNSMANDYSNNGRYALSLEYNLKSLELFKRIGDIELLAQTHYFMGVAYENLGMNSKAYESYLYSIADIKALKDSSLLFMAYGTIVFPLIALKEYDEAKKYMALALNDTINGNKSFILARNYDAQGQLIMDQKKYSEAIPYFNKAYDKFIQLEGYSWASPFMKLYLTECYLKIGDLTNALKNGLECFEMVNADNSLTHRKITLLLSQVYEQLDNHPMAFKYLKMYQSIRSVSDAQDEINRIADAEVLSILEKSRTEIDLLEKQKIQKEQETKIQRLWIFGIAGALISVIVLSLVLYRSNQHKKNANRLLKKQKNDIQETLERLKTTQSQLIQSEKMASLGELTAGIAHEIQNPLNFVNNFSEVNVEILNELTEGPLKKLPEKEKTEAIEIVADLSQNNEKINNHGKRADAIVKGMLQHSRSSSGQKEPIDINALADEYLRLAYHGLRAKEKSFNADFNLELDEKLPKIKAIPQDIGRVLLNLINNAFYACSEKFTAAEALDEKDNIDYKPLVTVSTQKLNGKIEISVKDNGKGIPEPVRDKIFQPFFTTKPTGSGTGLGLSLSYDIVKSHGGDIFLETEKGKWTEFIVKLPYNTE